MDELISRKECMESIVKEYNRRTPGQGLKLAYIEKAVNDTRTKAIMDEDEKKVFLDVTPELCHFVKKLDEDQKAKLRKLIEEGLHG